MTLPPVRATPSTIVLVAANAIPLLGVLYLGWEVFPLILLYWLENVLVGVLNVVKIVLAQPQEPLVWLGKLFLIPFFCVHYGIFTGVHGVFVFAMFAQAKYQHTFLPTWPLVMRAIHDTGIGLAVVALLMSHLVSLAWNYLISGEFRRASPQVLMMQPYARVIILHLTIIGGGFLTLALGQPKAAVLALVVVKTIVDLGAHVTERARLALPGSITISVQKSWSGGEDPPGGT